MDKIDEFEVELTSRLRRYDFDVLVWYIKQDRLELRAEKGDYAYDATISRALVEQANSGFAKLWADRIIGSFDAAHREANDG